MVIIDCIEGCAVRTMTVLRQALAERVIPNLFVIKVDRCTLENPWFLTSFCGSSFNGQIWTDLGRRWPLRFPIGQHGQVGSSLALRIWVAPGIFLNPVPALAFKPCASNCLLSQFGSQV